MLWIVKVTKEPSPSATHFPFFGAGLNAITAILDAGHYPGRFPVLVLKSGFRLDVHPLGH